MLGTIINVVGILIGSAIGILIGNRLPKRTQESVMTALGLVTLVVGVQSALASKNILIPLLALASGTVVGESIDIDGALKRFGGWLQRMVARLGNTRPATGEATESTSPDTIAQHTHAARIRFINGFVTASLVFCVGPMTVLGSIQNGINAADIRLLAIKSTLDFFAAIAFAASLGMGVSFSALTALVIQGGFAIVGMAIVGVAGGASGLTDANPYIREFGATGGLLLMGIALVLMDIKQPRVANYLPALLIAPLLIWIATLLGIPVYPF